MKKLFLAIVFAFCANVMAQETTTIYLIRHAEKADNSTNPELSEAGKARAQRWAEYFKGKNIRVFYTTTYLRTLNTVLPTASVFDMTPGSSTMNSFHTYDPKGFSLKGVAEKYPGQNILIAGHSNTIPANINELLGKKTYADINENDYGNLYIIKITGDKITHELVKM